MAPSKGKKKKGLKNLKDNILIFEEEKKKMAKMYETSTKLWEMKLKRAQQELAYHRKELNKRASDIEQVKGSLFMVEKSNIGITDYWLKELKDKDEKLKVLGEKIKKQEEIAAQRKLEVEKQRKRDLEKFEEDILKRKATEARVQKKIINIRKQMQVSKEEYRENLKIRDEKYSVLLKESREKEWNFICKEREMDQLKAEQENTIVKLETELSDVNREKTWLIKNLKFALINLDELKQMAQRLSKEKLLLAVDRNFLVSTLQTNICELECKEEMIAEVTARAACLEHSLKQMEEESTENEKRNQVTIQASQVELDKLQKIIAMREKELCQVKKLARTIVEKRKDMEVFFHEALDNVRQEIAEERKRKVKEANQDCQKFRDGTEGKGKFPLIHTIDQSPNSTNSVYSDMKAPGNWPHCPGKEVYMSDLTWEQKEKVLTLLFAKMNGNAERASKSNMMRLDYDFQSGGLLHRRGLQEGFMKVL
ncbi:PREDICTED: basal body-orientation factor 1-like [Poecilia mexicana]|uniref:basal body-orientation factor 1-like n=1 Tax=Poecilia mexicana TaxID=48701 RepID=UPI00072ECE2D|nr:PREDICTED: basal body-orientation factor 1-like [Poecilia mexicana]